MFSVMAKVVFCLGMVEILLICSSGEDEGSKGWRNLGIEATAWTSPGPMEQQGDVHEALHLPGPKVSNNFDVFANIKLMCLINYTSTSLFSLEEPVIKTITRGQERLL